MSLVFIPFAFVLPPEYHILVAGACRCLGRPHSPRHRARRRGSSEKIGPVGECGLTGARVHSDPHY
jgi:hypothetical protein